MAIDPGYQRASTASRLDSFILPGSLQFAEYNAESPAGLGYTETLVGVFDTLAVTRRFRERYDARAPKLMGPMLDALLASYREWGGTASPPTIAIVDFRGVPTWAEFEMLQARFIELGVPTVVCDPRDLAFDGTSLTVDGRHIDLVYRRCLINDIVDRPDDCRALVDAYRARAVCVANTLRCKLPHKKAFFSVLTDARYADVFDAADRATIAPHVPWTRLVREGRTERHGEIVDLIPYVRAHRARPGDEAQRRLRRPRRDAGLGGRRGGVGRHDCAARSAGRTTRGSCRRRFTCAASSSRASSPASRRRPRRHAGGLRAVPVPRQAGRLPHAPQRRRARQRHLGRRPGAVVRRPREGCLMTDVNHRDTENTEDAQRRLGFVGMSPDVRVHPSAAKTILCGVSVFSVSLWLTSVIEWSTCAV